MRVAAPACRHYSVRAVSVDGLFLRKAASCICSAARTPGHAAALRDADKRRDYFADHNCPGYAFRAISFETLGQFRPGAMQYLCEAIHAAFPQPGHQRSVCFANVHRQLSVVQCGYLSRMLSAAADLHTARTGSGWIRGTPLPSPGSGVPHEARGCSCWFGCVGRCLGSDCVLLIAVKFCYIVGLLVVFLPPPFLVL
jgi:hypothetical protein